jgi:hypothetical protein
MLWQGLKKQRRRLIFKHHREIIRNESKDDEKRYERQTAVTSSRFQNKELNSSTSGHLVAKREATASFPQEASSCKSMEARALTKAPSPPGNDL